MQSKSGNPQHDRKHRVWGPAKGYSYNPQESIYKIFYVISYLGYPLFWGKIPYVLSESWKPRNGKEPLV